MRYMYKILLYSLLLFSTLFSFGISNVDAASCGNYSCDILNVGSAYESLQDGIIDITIDFLDSQGGEISDNLNLTALRDQLSEFILNRGGWYEEDDCKLVNGAQSVRDNCYRYLNVARISGTNLIVGCGNADVAIFRNVVTPSCEPQESQFSCEDLEINGQRADANGNIVLFAGHFNAPLEISGLNQIQVANTCPSDTKQGPDRMVLNIRQLDSIVANADTNLGREVLSTGQILNNDIFDVTTPSGDRLIQIGNYELDFFPHNGSTNLGIAGGNCSLQIIEDPVGGDTCGVNANGSYNGTGNGLLDPGEQCDLGRNDVTGLFTEELGTWGDKNPRCSETCQTINYCGDGIVQVDLGEQCEQSDPSSIPDGKICNNMCQLSDDPGNGDPAIYLLKYSNNSDDLDSNTTLGTEDNDSQTIVSGTSSQFQIYVGNSGSVNLTNVVISDLEAPACERNATETASLISTIGPDSVFNPGESFTYNCELPNTTSGYTNIAEVIANPVGQPNVEVRSDDDSEVIIDGPSIDVQKYNGNPDDQDNDPAAIFMTPADDNQTINEGDDAIFKITVKNTGTRDLENLVLTDDLASNCSKDLGILPAEQGNVPGEFENRTGRTNTAELEDTLLQPGEEFTYSCTKQNVDPSFTVNTVTVDATQVGTGTPVSDTDSTNITVGVLTCQIDGIKQDFETCDPQDPQEIGFGTRGCNNQCKPINGGGGGSSDPVCLEAEISLNDVICTGSLKTKTFRVQCNKSQPGIYQFESYDAGQNSRVELVNGKLQATVSCPGAINEPQCFVHEDEDANINTPNDEWFTSNSCKITDGGGGGNPVCPSADPRCGVCEYDNNGNLSSNSPGTCPNVETYPFEVSYHNPTYADNVQKKLLCLKVTDRFGNDIGADVFTLTGNDRGNPGEFSDNTRPPVLTPNGGLYVNQIDQTGGEAVTIHDAALIDSHVCMTMSSVAPGAQQFEFDIHIPTRTQESEFSWDGGYRTISAAVTSRPVEFRKPFIGSFEVRDGTLKPKINTKQAYNIKLNSVVNGTLGANYSNGLLDLNSQSVLPTTQGQRFSGDRIEVLKRSLLDDNNVRRDYAPFRATIQATNNDAILRAPGIRSNKIELRYVLDNRTVSYYLTENDRGNDTTEFFLDGETQETLGLKIVGPLQGDGKSYLTGQVPNFSDISKGPQRQTIKQKAYEIIRGLDEGLSLPIDTTVNNVRYVKGKDVALTGMPDSYETLVVEDGNVIITGDINGGGQKTLGIIVMSTSSSTGKDADGVYVAGNIFVQPNVSRIDALMYGDGGLISANNSGIPYTINSASRTEALSLNQLLINGTVFTRNTIGGAVDGTSGDNKLPGGEVTNNFNQASIYDLNYLRTGVRNLVEPLYPNAPTIIRYTPSIQNNPPKGFSN